MKAVDVMRAAHDVIAAGWCQGGNCRDAGGNLVQLFTGLERSRINPLASSFSLYGALCKGAGDHAQVQAPLMWSTLARFAEARSGAVPGGNNHLHPILAFNENPGRTQQDVLDLLTAAINELDPPAQLPAPSSAQTEGTPA